MWRRLGRALPLLGAWLLGCEALVNGQLGTVYCGAEGAEGPPTCPTGSICLNGVCTDRQTVPGALGLACASAAECQGGELCLDPKKYGGVGPLRCSIACCTSSDCGEGGPMVCWASGTGSFCRPAADLGRGAVGAGGPGEACADAADCRSGLCSCRSPGCSTKRCLDVCCSDTDCADGNGWTCGLATAGPVLGRWSCGPQTTGLRASYAPCHVGAECASGLCLEIGTQLRCAPACCGSAPCGSIPGQPTLVACAEVPAHGGTVRACSGVLPATATAAVGDPCTDGGQCRSGRCLAAGKKGYCTDLCCTDDDCGDPANVACRSYADGPFWGLRCELR